MKNREKRDESFTRSRFAYIHANRNSVLSEPGAGRGRRSGWPGSCGEAEGLRG